MVNEKWDLYNSKRERTGKHILRSEPVPTGYYHMVVHVCVFNEKGEMLIQKRQAGKQLEPDKWDVSAGGAAILGEDSYAAAQRELKEELGLEVDLSNVAPHATLFFDTGFDDYYLVECQSAKCQVHIAEREIQSIKWAGEDEILAMIDDGSFAHFKKSFMQLLFDLQQVRGSLTFKV